MWRGGHGRARSGGGRRVLAAKQWEAAMSKKRACDHHTIHCGNCDKDHYGMHIKVAVSVVVGVATERRETGDASVLR